MDGSTVTQVIVVPTLLGGEQYYPARDIAFDTLTALRAVLVVGGVVVLAVDVWLVGARAFESLYNRPVDKMEEEDSEIVDLMSIYWFCDLVVVDGEEGRQTEPSHRYSFPDNWFSGEQQMEVRMHLDSGRVIEVLELVVAKLTNLVFYLVWTILLYSIILARTPGLWGVPAELVLEVDFVGVWLPVVDMVVREFERTKAVVLLPGEVMGHQCLIPWDSVFWSILKKREDSTLQEHLENYQS